MITLHQANTTCEYECENCGRDTKQHYVLQKDNLTPKGVCEYCLQSVISQETAACFTVESIRGHIYKKEHTNIEVGDIEPISEDDFVELVEGTFIHECGSVHVEDDVFDELNVEGDSMDSFEKFAMDVSERDSRLQKVEVEVDDGDDEVIVEPSYERQSKLVEKLSLMEKWSEQSNPAVNSELIKIRREQIVEHTPVTDTELMNIS